MPAPFSTLRTCGVSRVPGARVYRVLLCNVARIKRRYMRGVDAIPPGLMNCLLTCVAGAIANQSYEGWPVDWAASVGRRILVGYLGALSIVVFVLPILRAGNNRRTCKVGSSVARPMAHRRARQSGCSKEVNCDDSKRERMGSGSTLSASALRPLNSSLYSVGSITTGILESRGQPSNADAEPSPES